MNRHLRMLVGTIAVALTAACGGGGGDSGAAPSAPPAVAASGTFSLQSGYRTRVVAGSSDSFTITGTCAGTAQTVNGAAAAATFEGVTGFSATQTATVTFTNCSPSNSTVAGINYFDANYAPIGSSVTGLDYARFLSNPLPLPTAAKVGDGTIIVTLTTYSDSSKAITTGQRVWSYEVAADTATTVVANLIVKTYNMANQLLLTQQTRYRVAADGTFTLLTIDLQYSGTAGTVHLLYTKV